MTFGEYIKALRDQTDEVVVRYDNEHGYGNFNAYIGIRGSTVTIENISWTISGYVISDIDDNKICYRTDTRIKNPLCPRVSLRAQGTIHGQIIDILLGIYSLVSNHIDENGREYSIVKRV